MTKDIAQTYQMLDEIDHIRKRTGMYAGSTAFQETEEWVFDPATATMSRRTIKYIPAFIKIFSEILDNSIDESKRAPDVLDTIRVEITPEGQISVYDNGRGIPCQIHPQSGKYVAETIFSNLRAGSNFNDDEDQALIGTNGVGSTITNVLSKEFAVESCDGNKLFRIHFSEGMRKRSEPKVKDLSDADCRYKKGYTKITFTPDYEFFKMTELDQDHRDKIMKKVVDAAGCNPHIKFYLNGTRIHIASFKDYAKFYDADVIYEENEDKTWAVAYGASDGYDHVSFVNSVDTYQGGMHVDYVINQVTEKLREYFKKKKKVDVKPGDIRAHMRVYISASVNRPKFSSQTKENMISPPSEWKTTYKVSDKVIAKILTSPIIQSVLDWIEAKEEAARRAKEREMNKNAQKFDPRRVEKFSDANERHERDKCILFLTEGDSAAKAIQSCADKRWMGTYPLRGKPLNVCDIDVDRLAKNAVFQAFLQITGLQIGVKINSIKDLRFGKICFMTDQDLDGFHITGLLLNMIRTYWPELLDMGVIYRFQTPLLKAFTKAGPIEFFDEADFVKWEASTKEKFTKKYYKGLGTSTTKEFSEYVQNLPRYLVPLTIVDEADYDSIDLAFNRSRAEDRKTWLDLKAA